MLFVLTPQGPSPAYFDPEQVYQDYRRREYVAALQEQHQRAQFERELALEEQRHRQALAAIAQQEAARRQRQASQHFPCHPQQQQQVPGPRCAGRANACGGPAREEIFRRRLARQQEEESLSREFHKHILSQIFGIAAEEAAKSAPQEPTPVPVPSTSAKGKESTVKLPRNEEPEPHWSAAPERARALAEITSITRTFTSLKNTFVFPSGALERLPNSDVPRLAYNPTNASIHAYEHALAELLSKLDGIESHGFKGVREARKQLVVKIEKVLEDLERQVAERLTEGSSPVTAPTSIPASPTVAHTEGKEPQDVMMQDEAQPEVQNVVMQEETHPEVHQASSPTEGYDVEPEPVQEVVMQESSEPTISSESTTEVTSTTTEPTVESSTEVAPPSHPEESSEPATINPAVLPASESDEESEIEDAIHIEVSSDEEDIVEAKHHSDDAHSDTEGVFEML